MSTSDPNNGDPQRVMVEGERWQGHDKLDPRLTAFLEMSADRLASWQEAETQSIEYAYRMRNPDAEQPSARAMFNSPQPSSAETTAESANTESANTDSANTESANTESANAEFADTQPSYDPNTGEELPPTAESSANADGEPVPTSTGDSDATSPTAVTTSPEGDATSGGTTGGTSGGTTTGGATLPNTGGTTEDTVDSFRVQPSPVLHGLELDQREPRARVFIRFRGDPERLRELGVNVRSVAGDIITADLPIRLLFEMEQHPDVVFVELSRPLKRTLDQSVPMVEADKLHTAACAATDPTTVLCPLRPPGVGDVSCAVEGEGVLIGLVDSGMDFRHPDFFDSRANSVRVLGIWDQSASADPAFPPPPAYGYGRLYTRAQLDADLFSGDLGSVVPYRAPEQAHGTHVAGIAAGNGAMEPAFTGLAPKASILFVECKRSDTRALADMVELAEAMDFIFTEAGTTPCVINASLGDNLGPHDGTSLVEAYIDNLLATPGRAVVLSAGNSTGKFKHTFSTVGATAQDILVSVPSDLASRLGETLEFWYDDADRLDLTITVPNPAGGSFVMGPISPGTAITYDLDGKLEVIVHSRVADSRNGDNVIIILLQPLGDNPILPGTWTYTLGPAGGDPNMVKNGRWNAWIDHNTSTDVSNGVAFAGSAVASCTVTTPGTSNMAITVGNHKTVTGLGIHDTSGVGPTRDGRIKPDIAAPGTTIAACKAVDWWADADGDGVPDLPTGFYTNKDGTSMAAPHVAGAIALLFEARDPNLTAQDAKYILQRLADTTGITTPNNSFGWGRLRLGNALCWVEDKPDLWCQTAPTDNGVEPFTGDFFWKAPDIWVRPERDGGLTHENPEFGQENHVHVRIHNRGAGPAFNTRVFLYWADPATDIPFSEWKTDGISVAGEHTNVQVIPELASGAELVLPIPFSWEPPAPGTSLRSDNHFCLLVRLECDLDPSSVGVGGFTSVREHNNIALKNVHIVDLTPVTDEAEAIFSIGGLKGARSLRLDLSEVPSTATAYFILPADNLDLLRLGAALPAAVAPLLRKMAKRPIPSDRDALIKLLDGRKLSGNLIGLHGVDEVSFENGEAVLKLSRGPVLLERLVFVGQVKARWKLTGLRRQLGTFEVHAEERINGNPVGGLTTVFQDRLTPRRVVTAVSGALRTASRGINAFLGLRANKP